MVRVERGEQVAGVRRHRSAGRTSLGGTLVILVAASAALTGCAGSADDSSPAVAPGSAVEDSAWDDVELTLVNASGQQFTASATINCTDVESYGVGPGESATFSPSSCSGSDGDVRDGKVTLASGDTLTFRADNPWVGYANVKFTSGSESHVFAMPTDVNADDLYCLGGWTVASTSYEDGDPRKLTVSIGQEATMPSSCQVPVIPTAQPLDSL